MLKRKLLVFVLFTVFHVFLKNTAFAGNDKSQAFNHHEWNALLDAHVIAIDGSTAVDYKGMAKDQSQLRAYLTSLEAVQTQEFDQWSNASQLAFLINAYNAWTVEAILSRWPEIDSIKDLGGFFSSPWKKSFIPLLGELRSLDNIEHILIRRSGRYNDPRIHFAVNCASIGCPALRPEAYTALNLNAQLEDQTQRFLADKTRNYVDGDTLALSSIFKWYKEDFEKGWQTYSSLEDFLIFYADALELNKVQRLKLQTSKLNIIYLDYDWRLNKLTTKE